VAYFLHLFYAPLTASLAKSARDMWCIPSRGHGQGKVVSLKKASFSVAISEEIRFSMIG